MQIYACQYLPASHRWGRASNWHVGVRVRGASVFVRPGDAGARTGGMRDDDLRLSVGPSRTSAVACADHRPGGSTCPWAPAGHRITAGSWHRGAKQAEKQCARIGGGETSPGPFFTLPASRRGRRPAADPRHPAGPPPLPFGPPRGGARLPLNRRSAHAPAGAVSHPAGAALSSPPASVGPASVACIATDPQRQALSPSPRERGEGARRADEGRGGRS
jgi:hypothetical protein